MVKKRHEIKKIIAKYINSLQALGIEVSEIILYGSYANTYKKSKEYSDIDIAVVSPEFKKLDVFERQELLSQAHHGFGEPIEPIGLTPAQVKEKKGFVKEIVTTGVVIYKKI